MTDGIPRGTGNSRLMKSVPDFLKRFPTYQDMGRALENGTFPFDLNGIDPAGWEQIGTSLNAGNLLKQSTAGMLNLPDPALAVPDDALRALMQSVAAANNYALHLARLSMGSGGGTPFRVPEADIEASGKVGSDDPEESSRTASVDIRLRSIPPGTGACRFQEIRLRFETLSIVHNAAKCSVRMFINHNEAPYDLPNISVVGSISMKVLTESNIVAKLGRPLNENDTITFIVKSAVPAPDDDVTVYTLTGADVELLVL